MEQLALAKSRLFGDHSMMASNFKLFPGSNRDVTPDALAEQINKAISQVEAGDFEEADLED